MPRLRRCASSRSSTPCISLPWQTGPPWCGHSFRHAKYAPSTRNTPISTLSSMTIFRSPSDISVSRATKISLTKSPQIIAGLSLARHSREYRLAPGGARRAARLQCRPASFRAAPDLFDDDAVVALGLAGAHAGFQHVGVDLQRRQALAMQLGLIEHQVRVLECLRDAALRLEIAGDHLRSLGVHHLRVGRRAARDLEESLGVEPES